MFSSHLNNVYRRGKTLQKALNIRSISNDTSVCNGKTIVSGQSKALR